MSTDKILDSINKAEVLQFPSRKPASVDIECSQFPMTDLGNAQRFICRNGDAFCFVPEWGWLAWDGRRWNTSEAEALVAKAVHDTIRRIVDEAAAIEGTEHDHPVGEKKSGEKPKRLSDMLRKWCLTSQSANHLAAVSRLAQPDLSLQSSSFDRDPMAFNVDNGTLRFKKSDFNDYVQFTPHRRGDRITKTAHVEFDPSATCPLYDAFMARIQPDESIRRSLHAWGGISLTGLQLARLAFWYGTGRNGKSTLIDIWAHVMGEYSQTIPIESFLDQGRARRGGEASPDIAALPGIRCLRTSEPERGARLAESLVKLVTGGEPLRARHLNRDFFEFRPEFKLTMQGNYRPEVRGTDEGIWSRIMLVPFGVMIPEHERDPELFGKLKGEAPGILNRLLDGLRDYMDNGLHMPDAVSHATREYREDSDPIASFLTECAERRPEAERAKVSGRDIYRLYVAWARAQGERVWSPKAFSRSLQDHGITRFKSNGSFYRNLVLTKSGSDFEQQFISEDVTD